MTMMMLLFLLWVYPRNLPLKLGQNWGSNRSNVAFVVVVIVIIVVVVVIVVVVDPRTLILKLG